MNIKNNISFYWRSSEFSSMKPHINSFFVQIMKETPALDKHLKEDS